MIDKKDIEKIEKFCNGLSTEEEEIYIYSLFAENEDNLEFKHQIKYHFNRYIETNKSNDYNLDYLLDRIHHHIHLKENKEKRMIFRRISRWYSVVAAVLFIPILIAGGIMWNKQYKRGTAIAEAPVATTIYAPLGSRISFALPDGTIGWLNSGSTIKYSIPFIKNRKVEISGEGWFDVTHNANYPFEVTAGKSTVKVLGTCFNIDAYPEEKYVEVVLEKGQVDFFTPGLKSIVKMMPNERLVFSNGAVDINKTDASKYSSWKEGKLEFRGDSMDEVARRISRWYNVNVKVIDNELKNYTFRGTFLDDSLEEILHYIAMTSPIGYRIIGRETLTDGMVRKETVLLFKKN